MEKEPTKQEAEQEFFPGTSDAEKTLPLDERFNLQRDGVVRHYLEAYATIPNASRDREDVTRAIREFVEDKGLFRPTKRDEREYENPNFSEDALNKTVEQWQRDVVTKTMEALENLGMIDRERKKKVA